MSHNFRIAIRFLLAKKRSMLMSLAGIVFGVGFFISTQAQLSGYQELFIETILGTDGAIRIEDRIQATSVFVEAASSKGNSTNFFLSDENNRRFVEGIEHPESVVVAIMELSNIEATSSVLKGSVQLQSALREDSGQVFGITVDDHLAVSALEDQIDSGSIIDFRQTPMGVILGVKLAARLDVSVGDSLIIRAVDQQRRLKISALYETGVSDIDKKRVFMHINTVRSLLKKPHGVSFIQVSVFDRARTMIDSQLIENVTNHFSTPWQEREKSLLELFKILRISSAITVSTIIIVSGLGMFSMLVMIVMEKTREIAILRSMGYTRGDISSIFLWQGAIVLVLGTAIGCCLGVLMTFGISKLPMPSAGLFTAEFFEVNWSGWHYIQAVVAATVIVMIASLIPARRAARLVPGDVIRGTAA
ncbi:MAG: FtsX-like permease family protein [Opitutaceae bacterium]|nr:FtsX-like permease family protein [Opitutaceae bacterium]